MNLNHLNLTVTKPLETREFLVKYFGLKPAARGNEHIAFLSDDNGMVISLTNVKPAGNRASSIPPISTLDLARKAKSGSTRSTSV